MGIIQVENLTKIYKTRQVAKGLKGGIQGLFKVFCESLIHTRAKFVS